jgi:hypothetical protein
LKKQKKKNFRFKNEIKKNYKRKLQIKKTMTNTQICPPRTSTLRFEFREMGAERGKIKQLPTSFLTF